MTVDRDLMQLRCVEWIRHYFDNETIHSIQGLKSILEIIVVIKHSLYI